MATEPSNLQATQIGLSDARVILYSGLPLAKVPRQEMSYYFTPTSTDRLINGKVIKNFSDALRTLPSPVNGIALDFDIQWHDNYLEFLYPPQDDNDLEDIVKIGHLTWRTNTDTWLGEVQPRADRQFDRSEYEALVEQKEEENPNKDDQSERLKELQETKKKLIAEIEKTQKSQSPTRLRSLKTKRRLLKNTLESIKALKEEMKVEVDPEEEPEPVFYSTKWEIHKTSYPLEGEEGKQSVKLPYQVATLGNTDNEESTDLGIHWALEKSANIFSRTGLVLEFLHRDEPKVPSKTEAWDAATNTLYPFLHIPRKDVDVTPMSTTEISSVTVNSKGSVVSDTNQEVKDKVKQNFLPFVSKDIYRNAYHVIELSNTGENKNEKYFIVITSEGHPKFIVTQGADKYVPPQAAEESEESQTKPPQATKNDPLVTQNYTFLDQDVVSHNNSDYYVKTLSEYEPANGIDWLRAEWLRLVVENVGPYIVIYNNLNDIPWVIQHVKQRVITTETQTTTGEGEDATTEIVTRKDLDQQISNLVIDGRLKVYGGNMPSGVLYAPLTYKTEDVELEQRLVEDDPNSQFIEAQMMTSFTYARYNDHLLQPRMQATLEYKGDVQDNNEKYTEEDPANINPEEEVVQKQFTIGASADVVIDNFRTLRKNRQQVVKKTTDNILKLVIDSDSFPPKVREAKTNYKLTFKAGDMTYSSGDFDGSLQVFLDKFADTNGFSTSPQSSGFLRVTTPVLYSMRTHADTTEPWVPIEAFDVTDDVVEIVTNSNASNYQEIRHTVELTLHNKVRNRTRYYTKDQINSSGEGVPTFNDLALIPSKEDGEPKGVDYKIFLKRNMYIRIIGSWTGIGESSTDSLFSGIAYGGSVSKRAEQEVVKLECEDFMKVLDDVPMLNSPFYDGMGANAAVKDIVKRASMTDEQLTIDAGLTSEKEFILPIGYTFLQPKLRFPDDTSIKEAILKIARMDWRVMYFDNNGKFHYSDLPGGNTGLVETTDVKQYFYSTPYDAITETGEKKRIEPDELIYLTYREKRESWNMGDVKDVIQVLTVDKLDRNPIIKRHYNWSGLEPSEATSDSSIGYVGYFKPYISRAPYLGDLNALRKYMRNLYRLFRPPYSVSFEIYGIPRLQALDIILIDGKPARLTSVQSTLNKKDNQYWTQITAEWFEREREKDEDGPPDNNLPEPEA